MLQLSIRTYSHILQFYIQHVLFVRPSARPSAYVRRPSKHSKVRPFVSLSFPSLSLSRSLACSGLWPARRWLAEAARSRAIHPFRRPTFLPSFLPRISEYSPKTHRAIAIARPSERARRRQAGRRPASGLLISWPGTLLRLLRSPMRGPTSKNESCIHAC